MQVFDSYYTKKTTWSQLIPCLQSSQWKFSKCFQASSTCFSNTRELLCEQKRAWCIKIRFLVGCLLAFLTSSSKTRLYRRRAPRQSVWQFNVLPYMRHSWETMTSVSAGHITLTPTQPVRCGRPQRELNPEPPHQESCALQQSCIHLFISPTNCSQHQIFESFQGITSLGFNQL